MNPFDFLVTAVLHCIASRCINGKEADTILYDGHRRRVAFLHVSKESV